MYLGKALGRVADWETFHPFYFVSFGKTHLPPPSPPFFPPAR
jgi:hypothetical protein